MHNETHQITTCQELEKYVGKLIVTHYNYGSYSKSIRILASIENTENKTSLLGCRIYGKYILRFKRNGIAESTFCCGEGSLYAANVEYVTLPTTEEKHLFMEKYSAKKIEE